MDAKLMLARLKQAQQICTYINMKVAKGDFAAAAHMARNFIVILTQVGMPDLLREAEAIINQLNQGDAQVTTNVAKFSQTLEVKIAEQTPRVHLANEVKCPHCHADILEGSKFCGQCGKQLTS